MPTTFLTFSDQARLSRCPDDLPSADLDTYFQLTPEDLSATDGLRGDGNRLGFALQLCCLRYLGFFPSNLLDLAEAIVVMLRSSWRFGRMH